MKFRTGHIRLPALVPGSVLLLGCALLSGCLFGGSSQPPPSPEPLSPVRQFIVSRTPGSAEATGTVSDPEFGRNLRIVLEREFLAASGETCRQASLFAPDGDAEVVVMCRDASGVWSMAPRIWGRGLPPASQTPSPSGSAAPDPAPRPGTTPSNEPASGATKATPNAATPTPL